jgi:hypothetical protein
MACDSRNLLDVLKQELQFLEGGGYGHIAAHYWKPVSVFQNSPSCPNVDDPHRSIPCEACALFELVPPYMRDEGVPLNTEGETIHGMERQYSQEELLEAVGLWLRTLIRRLEKDGAHEAN